MRPNANLSIHAGHRLLHDRKADAGPGYIRRAGALENLKYPFVIRGINADSVVAEVDAQTVIDPFAVNSNLRYSAPGDEFEGVMEEIGKTLP